MQNSMGISSYMEDLNTWVTDVKTKEKKVTTAQQVHIFISQSL